MGRGVGRCFVIGVVPKPVTKGRGYEANLHGRGVGGGGWRRRLFHPTLSISFSVCIINNYYKFSVLNKNQLHPPNNFSGRWLKRYIF